eukprot:5464424-Pyramimonas_sp.AAC.1
MATARHEYSICMVVAWQPDRFKTFLTPCSSDLAFPRGPAKTNPRVAPQVITHWQCDGMAIAMT